MAVFDRRSVLASLTSLALGGPALQRVPKLLTVARADEGQVQALTERLGYGPEDKLLIIHADDLAVSHSVNAASIKALASGAVSSASIMVPCPWLPEVAEYAKANPQADLGLHLTLTSEWSPYRWGPVAPRDRVPTLLADDGYFHSDGFEAVSKINPKEAEIEIHAQIEKARALGIRPTHLDSHMGVLFKTRELFQVFVQAGRSHGLPILISKSHFSRADFFATSLRPGDVILDNTVSITPAVSADLWAAFYADAIARLRPGITQFIVHLSYDDDEMRAVTADHPDWGAAWRQRDFDFFCSERCRKLLAERDVKLVSWRQIGKLL